MKWSRSLRNEKGFTLVEIAIVLIIIGLILGATVKGGDLIQSAKQKKFYNSFVKQWELTVLNYYDRTGGVLGDGIVNGGVNATTNGVFDNINSAAEWTAVENRLRAVGLEIPTTNTTNSYQFTFKGKQSGARTITVNLYSLNATSGGGGGGGVTVANNALYMTNMPTDLAIATDRIVDGVANGQDGTFRQYTDANDWPDITAAAVVNTMYIMDVP